MISEEARKWWTPTAVASGLSMIMPGNTVVNVVPATFGGVVSFVRTRGRLPEALPEVV